MQANPTGTNPDALRPYKGFSTIIEAQNTGGSFFHAMQANLKRRLTQGLSLWRRLHLVQEPRLRILERHQHHQRIRQQHHVRTKRLRHSPRACGELRLEYPLRNSLHATGSCATTLGDWQFSGTVQAQSGRPPSGAVSRNLDQAGVGPGSGNQYYVHTRVTATAARVRHYTAPQRGSTRVSSSPQPSALLLLAAPATSSTALASKASTPRCRRASTSSRAMRTMNWSSEQRPSTSLNHPNWDNPDVNPTSSTFGKVTSKGTTYASERQFQFSLRYVF